MMGNQSKYELLDLSYMKEISRGDLTYEQQVTALFIEIIPEDLINLKIHSESKSIEKLKMTLHHMQSSISIMGLDERLSAYMDIDAYEETSSKAIQEKIDFIIAICIQAIEEAKDYLKSLA